MKNYFKKNKMKGFTLVELLAVIVILAIVLVIAVPKVISVIEDSKKATLESTAKMIASSAEKAKVQNTVLGNTDRITCDSIAKINDVDYEDCDIDFENNIAKVTIKGSGKFNGLWVCNGTKTSATAINESCGLRTLTVDLDGGTDNVDYNAKYEGGSTITLTEPVKEGYTFVSWVVESGEGAEVTGSTLKMGTTATKVKATWEKKPILVTLTVDLAGGTDTVDYNAKYEVGSTVTLTAPTKEGYEFKEWVVETGEGAEVTGNTLKMGTTSTKVKAIWEEKQVVVPENGFSEDDWATIVASVKEAERMGWPYPYEVGETKTVDLDSLGTHTLRVANVTKCNNSLASATACGFVLEFADIIVDQPMYTENTSTGGSTLPGLGGLPGGWLTPEEETPTNVGGWPATEISVYVNETIYNALPQDLRNGIIETNVVSSHGIADIGNGEDDNFESMVNLYLLSTMEVWGSNPEGADTSAYYTITRQLDYYENKGVTTYTYEDAAKEYQGNRTNWWLRSALSDTDNAFFYVGPDGYWGSDVSYTSLGVSPAFRLAE